MLEIQLKGGASNAHQKFSVQLGDNFLDFTLDYITYIDSPAWSLTIERDGSALVRGAMLEAGSDIIEHYRAGIGSLVFVGEPATLDNLGIANQLVWMG